ncbi:hypothetical protein ABB37_03834 [Leptomonas pyrrhocoris]|uniref:Pre-mRNA-splicing factor Syf1/CRNKL1-like C-terminal HAT-repeats domain-containing protein n=1 Tax=Leptomonas pyrrhocoris TaxID=157538 RepID=A0A0M9G3H4_LEPPY|nr:hypothetical protein ABB37_03834 [Leptomonas pyrrhocoris]KPA81477.1 hypothetical protein ABB37_03834 [Leptomonas pyrrhocoris]|eukprot:XP_015659916.1 hypothetical protein ABB37_03834 [Leptomonas pyrrhocoris]
MKRSRQDNRRLGPAAAAMRRNDVYRDGRQAEDQVSTQKLFKDAVAMQKFHSPNQSGAGARVMIHSREELALYRQKRRSELEESVRRGYKAIGNWIRYARWEAQQRDFDRMRAVMERAVAVHGENGNLWRDYAELEEVNGFIEHARQVWNRGVSALPSSVDLWVKYLAMEQAAGQDQRVRDVFHRWLAGDAAPPCAYELAALYEAQQRRQAGCRDVLRQYVERYNSPASWLLYSATEQQVFGDFARAVKVLQKALQALPDESVWSPEEECRVPLALAEAHVLCGDPTHARAVFHDALEKAAASPPVQEKVLLAYSRFERLHGDGAHFEQVARLRTIQVYEERLRTNVDDFDAYLTLYSLYRDQERETGAMSEAKIPAGLSSSTAVVPSLSAPAVQSSPARQMLRRALAIPAKDAYSAQQRAVLVMEYARCCERDGNPDEARRTLAQELRQFPFDAALCPRLWIEAALLEERCGGVAQARKLLRAGAQVTNSAALFKETIRFEERQREAAVHAAAAAAAATHTTDVAALSDEIEAAVAAPYVAELRTDYQNAIQAFPFDVQWWLDYAKLEEQQRESARADALYAACIRTFNAEAARVVSFTQRYDLLAHVDAAWAHRIHLHTRRCRALQRQLSRRKARPEDVEVARAELTAAQTQLTSLYAALLQDVWDAYRSEAVTWYEKYFEGGEGSGEGVLSGAAPSKLPATLTPATARWSEAVEAVAAYLERMHTAKGPTAGDREEAKTALRAILKAMVQTERHTIRHALGWTEQTTHFDAVQRAREWGELLLSPLLNEWSKFELTHGGSLEAVKEVIERPTKRRTRLFKPKS